MNSVELIGRFANTPELKQTGSGIPVTGFTLAVDRSGTYGDDKKTDWIECVAWRSTAEFICKYFEKGSPIAVKGSIQTRNWEKDGVKRKSIEVVVSEAEFTPKSREHLSHEVVPTIQEESVSIGTDEEFSPVTDEDLPF